jgi:polyisoprenoid-binding protein YceI
LAIYEILHRKPDLLLSGINHGENTSTNVLYSGTMSAAVEGAMENIPSIGFSLADFDANADFSGATIELTAEAKTINTYLSMRDDHLRSADFFDVEKYPSISFKSTSVKKAKGNKYVITGNFTMHGVTKTVVLAGVHSGTTKNRAGADLAGLKITGMVKRTEYGVGATMPNTVVADEVYLNADLEVSKN